MSKVMKKLKINGAGNRRDSWQLLGLEIEQTETGFELVSPRRVLATAQLVNLDPTNEKPVIISFDVKNYQGWDWKIDVLNDVGDKMSGSWRNNDFFSPDVSAADESDNWTATGTGADPDKDETKAASAK
jgi:hypothetical protein